jgi:predicted GNAT family acetyltransferase
MPTQAFDKETVEREMVAPMTDARSVSVLNNEALRRFEAHLDGRRLGIAEYRLEPGRVIFVHTEVDPSVQRRGVGHRLAERALNDARESGLRVVAECSFIANFIDEHPEFHDLVSTP